MKEGQMILDDVQSLDDLLKDEDMPDVQEREPVEYKDCESAYPHIVVSLQDLRKILKVGSIVHQVAGRADIPNTVGLEVVDGMLNCYMTDVDNYFFLSLPIQNENNVLNGYFGLHYDILSKASKVAPQKVIIYSKDKRYFMELEGGDFELSVQDNIAKNSLVYDNLSKFKKEGEIEGGQFVKALKSLAPLVLNSVVPSQKMVYFGVGNDKSKAYSMYNHSVARFDGKKDFPELTVSIRGIKAFLSLIEEGSTDILTVERDSDLGKVRVGNERFYYIFDASSYKLPVVDKLDVIFEDLPLTKVDYKHLSNIADLASDIPYSLSTLEFDYLDDGYIKCSMLTKRTDSVFVLKGDAGEMRDSKSKPLQIPSLFLKVILKVFTDDSLGIVLYDKGLGLVAGENTAVIFSN